MHNIYITLWHLHSINGLIILGYITIQDISKTEFKFKGSIDMVTSTSKHDITKEKYKHCMLKLDNEKIIIMIEESLNNDIIMMMLSIIGTKISNYQ